ncbi:MAG: ABC transporter substrate binding protein [Pseudomonadota bacterium]
MASPWRLRVIAFVFLAGFTASSFADSALPRCLFVSSYHQGYAWSDGVERGLRRALAQRCELRQFDMDTKRAQSEMQKQAAAAAAKALIESWKPDVVIAADDNAAKYLIAPYFRDAKIPIVFCGINWTAKEYGFPYQNVTGMVEVAPIGPLLKWAARMVPSATRAAYIGADTLTESKNVKRFQSVTGPLGIALEAHLVGSTDAWVTAYERSQSADFVILGSFSGINDWDEDAVEKSLLAASRRLSVTNHEWMMPYAMVGLTKVAEEQGHWAGMTATAILDGMSPQDIPIIANQTWDIWANERLLRRAEIRLPRALRKKAKRVE